MTVTRSEGVKLVCSLVEEGMVDGQAVDTLTVGNREEIREEAAV